jgi:hypothetical protein
MNTLRIGSIDTKRDAFDAKLDSITGPDGGRPIGTPYVGGLSVIQRKAA